MSSLRQQQAREWRLVAVGWASLLEQQLNDKQRGVLAEVVAVPHSRDRGLQLAGV